MEMKDQETKFMANIAFIFKIITIIACIQTHKHTENTNSGLCMTAHF